MGDVTFSFGDNVRIRSTPVTEKLGLAGQTGSICGETTPSVTGVEVIGEVVDDYAVNVMIETGREQLWFAPDLVEFIDHGAGTEVRIGNKHLVRDASGEWSELPGSQPPLKPIHRLMRSFRGRRLAVGKRPRVSRRFRVVLAFTALLVLYIGSYIVLSARGGWYWSQTGKLRYDFGFAVSDVERWFPAWAYWEPFRDISGNDTSRGDWPGYIYSPLIRLDRAWVHPDREVFAATRPAS